MTDDPDLPEVDELIAEIRRLRLALTIDLAAAAGALEDDETELAADIIASAGGPSSIPRHSHPPRQGHDNC
jgi:hypothetical protein